MFYVAGAAPFQPPDTSDPEIELWFIGELLLADTLSDELEAQTYFFGDD
ncbi:hypothetical protein [Shinella sp.]|nr:hypothetical protein [Shinella sp.]